MKEFIDKLIERLEELQQCQIEKYTKSLDEGNLACIYDKTDIEDAKVGAVWKVLDIVTQLAEEYKGGWIPVSERLPKPIDDMLQCVIVTDENDWQGMAYYHPQKGWVFAECHNSDRKIDWTEIIAWQPLPAPCTEGE